MVPCPSNGQLHSGRLPGTELMRRTAKSHKVVLLGEASVGKTSLVLRLNRDEFAEITDTTIGAAFCPHTLDVNGTPVKLEIWDTAGQERFSSLAPMYYRGANAAIVVYDQTSSSSFDRAVAWIQQLQVSNPDALICLAANKADIAERVVDSCVAREYANRAGIQFFETSAKTGLNVEPMFQAIGLHVTQVSKAAADKAAERETVVLGESKEDSAGGSGMSLSNCCGIA